MFLSSGILEQSVGAAAGVQLPYISFFTGSSSGPVYSGVRFDSDGYIYKMGASGGWSQRDAWLLSGAASDYYLWRTVTWGSLTNDDGDGNQLNTDNLDYSIQNNVPWFERGCSVQFKISSDSAGSNILVTSTYNLTAYYLGTGLAP